MFVAGDKVWERIVPFTPLSLFSNGEQGVWFDPSDLSSMYQDAAGTIPAAIGQPVGLILDKSGNGNHASQATTTARPTLMQDVGGRPYLSFDGVDDYMQAPAESSPLGSTPSYMALIAQYESTGYISNAGLAAAGSGVTNSSRAIGVESTGMIKVDTGGPGKAAPLTVPVPLTRALWEASFGQATSVAVNGDTFASTASVAGTAAGGFTIGRGITSLHRKFRLYGAVHFIGTMDEDSRKKWVAWAKQKGGVQ